MKRLKFVCTDMWAPYLKVIKKKAPQAMNVLDRFHIIKHINEAIDRVYRAEIRRPPQPRLTHPMSPSRRSGAGRGDETGRRDAR